MDFPQSCMIIHDRDGTIPITMGRSRRCLRPHCQLVLPSQLVELFSQFFGLLNCVKNGEALNTQVDIACLTLEDDQSYSRLVAPHVKGTPHLIVVWPFGHVCPTVDGEPIAKQSSTLTKCFISHSC